MSNLAASTNLPTFRKNLLPPHSIVDGNSKSRQNDRRNFFREHSFWDRRLIIQIYLMPRLTISAAAHPLPTWLSDKHTKSFTFTELFYSYVWLVFELWHAPIKKTTFLFLSFYSSNGGITIIQYCKEGARVAQLVQQLAKSWTVRRSNPGGGRDFPHLSRPALRPNQPPTHCVPRLSRW